jgi:hypothetical protein
MATAGSPTLADESAVAARPRPWRWAVLGAVLVLAWQALTVQANYAGNWSGLFRTGTLVSVLPQLASSTFRDPSPHGYDGQYYRFLAHDPFLRSGASAYLDGPKVRASRILVPLAAWALAAGRPGLIDAAYVLVLAGFIFAGVYWLASIMLRLGRPPALGLLFLVIPATVVSIDRMTVDVALGALTAGFVLYFLEDREPGMWLTAAAAGLVRETGLLLVAACVLAALFRRDFRKSVLWAAAAIPTLCWYAYIQWALPRVIGQADGLVPGWAIPRLRLGILLRLIDPPQYPLPVPLEMIARGLDSLALAAMIAAAVIATMRLRRTPEGALRIALALHALLLVAMNSKEFWDTPFGYGRPFAPLFVLLLAAAGTRFGTAAVARAACLAALVDLRLATEIKSQVFGVVLWITG